MDCSHLARAQGGPEPAAAFLQNTGACAAWEDGYEWRAIRDKQYTYAVHRCDGRELLFDHLRDADQVQNLAAREEQVGLLGQFREALSEKMGSLNDTFESCTWYRDHWTEDRVILRSATLDGDRAQ